MDEPIDREDAHDSHWTAAHDEWAREYGKPKGFNRLELARWLRHRNMMSHLEEKCGGVKRAARMLMVSYPSTYARWRRGASVPKLVHVASLEAHLLMPDHDFRMLAERRLITEVGKRG